MPDVIRPATLHDAIQAWAIRREAVLAQCARHYPMPDLIRWTEGELPSSYAELVAKCFHVVERDGAVIATGTVNLDSGQLDAIFVASRHSGQGVGKAIMNHLEQLARQQGLGVLTLKATLNAAPFYRRCGFVGEAVSEYCSPRGISLACVPMQKSLAEG
ncbi:GNAT superfamily N-acetyltransferase [Chitinivorax tropicus]|uniref:GNAT superfamily N-acetyltransferase n=1 Tax=Chitinivorax tropicus TaxID=714531 RepID=A0A840MJY7_9PROT|nr:GNAT family N-acetyltransferase [Chitinivorax tropicus]MBB5017012.1 GNAT superfamily N-acetyltransferase [Chitinivorax tropicus]